MADGVTDNSVRTCAEHHRGASSRGRSYPTVVVMHGHFRPEAEIRPDLRAQLYAMLAPWERRLSAWRQGRAFLGGE